MRASPSTSLPCPSTRPTPSRSAVGPLRYLGRPLAELGGPPVRRAVRPAGEPGRRAALRGVGLRPRVHGLALVRRGRPAHRPRRRAARGPGQPGGRPRRHGRGRRREPRARATGSRWVSRGGRGCSPTPPSRPSRGRPGRSPRPPASASAAATAASRRWPTRPTGGGCSSARRGAARRTPCRPGSGRARTGRRASTRSRSKAGWAGEPFRPTGAALLPDGDLLVLERRFPPIGARLVRLLPGEPRGRGTPGTRGRSPASRPPHPRQLRGGRGAARRLRPDARLPALRRQRLREDARRDAVGPAAHAAADVRPRGLRAQPASAIAAISGSARRSRPRRFIFSCSVVGRTPERLRRPALVAARRPAGRPR